jgi:hypothetical protein
VPERERWNDQAVDGLEARLEDVESTVRQIPGMLVTATKADGRSRAAIDRMLKIEDRLGQLEQGGSGRKGSGSNLREVAAAVAAVVVPIVVALITAYVTLKTQIPSPQDVAPQVTK